MKTVGLRCSYPHPGHTGWETVRESGLYLAYGHAPPAGVATHGWIDSNLQPLAPISAIEALQLPGAEALRTEDGVIEVAGTDLLLLALEIDEAREGGLQVATRQAYQRLLQRARALDYPYYVRVWNYFSAINRIDDGLERYRQFCIGRFEAFEAAGISECDYPSACALGHAQGGLLVYLLASRTQPEHFENPRQLSAYRYPAEYGPRSPSFARGSLLRLPGRRPQLFVSGTASVSGHQTLHAGDPHGQLRVTLDNLDALLSQVTVQAGLAGPLQPELLKVYLRDPLHLDTVRSALEERFGQTPALYVQADICRGDLLLEIDGVWCLPT